MAPDTYDPPQQKKQQEGEEQQSSQTSEQKTPPDTDNAGPGSDTGTNTSEQ